MVFICLQVTAHHWALSSSQQTAEPAFSPLPWAARSGLSVNEPAGPESQAYRICTPAQSTGHAKPTEQSWEGASW